MTIIPQASPLKVPVKDYRLNEEYTTEVKIECKSIFYSRTSKNKPIPETHIEQNNYKIT